MRTLSWLFKDEQGASAVEYALMLALISATIIVAVTLFGQSASNVFSNVGSTLDGLSGS